MEQRIIQGLPPSFHQTFLPERRNLSALLKIAAENFKGSIESISEKTSIPTGKSSGKVKPHIQYAEAMGLIDCTSEGSGEYSLSLTSFGKLVLIEDLGLQEELTQILLHLMMCRPIGGSSVWHTLFGKSRVSLGQKFSIEDATAFINRSLGPSKSIPGPIFSTYKEQSSLAKSNQLSIAQNYVTRNHLPTNPDYYWGYIYCWLFSWENVALTDQQIVFSGLEAKSGFFEITGWNQIQIDNYLSWAENHQIVKVDRATGEVLLLRTVLSSVLISKIYSELI
jgi:hypothetical protein